jgi:hypothetical protein
MYLLLFVLDYCPLNFELSNSQLHRRICLWFNENLKKLFRPFFSIYIFNSVTKNKKHILLKKCLS